MGYTFLYKEIYGNTYQSYLLCCSILLLGVIFNLFFSKLLPRILFKLFKQYLNDVIFEDFLDHVKKPFRNLVILIFLFLAFDQLDFPKEWRLVSVEKFGLRQLIYKSYQIFLIISIARVFLRIADFVAMVMKRRAAKTLGKMDDMLVPFVKDAIKINIVIISILFVLGAVFNLNITSIIAGLGIGGLAFALAAKETLENLLGSFTIFMDKPFQIGDFIQFGNTSGTVDRIGFRSTRLITQEKSILTVPNKKLVDAELDNLSLRPERKVKSIITLSHETKLMQLENIMKELDIFLHQHTFVTNEHRVRFYEYSDMGIQLLIEYFINKTDYESFLLIKQETNLFIKKIVESNGAMFATAEKGK